MFNKNLLTATHQYDKSSNANTCSLHYDRSNCEITLPCRPFISVTSVRSSIVPYLLSTACSPTFMSDAEVVGPH